MKLYSEALGLKTKTTTINTKKPAKQKNPTKQKNQLPKNLLHYRQSTVYVSSYLNVLSSNIEDKLPKMSSTTW